MAIRSLHRAYNPGCGHHRKCHAIHLSTLQLRQNAVMSNPISTLIDSGFVPPHAARLFSTHRRAPLLDSCLFPCPKPSSAVPGGYASRTLWRGRSISPLGYCVRRAPSQRGHPATPRQHPLTRPTAPALVRPPLALSALISARAGQIWMNRPSNRYRSGRLAPCAALRGETADNHLTGSPGFTDAVPVPAERGTGTD